MSFYNDKIKNYLYRIKPKENINNFNNLKNDYNNSGTIETTKMNSHSTINNNNESQNISQIYNNYNTIIKEGMNKTNKNNYNSELKINSINSTNIDEIIKNEMSSAIIDSFLSEHQIKSVQMFILYLSEIWKELSKEGNPSENINSGINLFTFNKYYHLPGLIGQRFFDLMDIEKKGYLSPREFISGMCTIFCEEINSLIEFIFKFYDFNEDNYITFDDIHAVLCYLPVVNDFEDMLDIEEEIYTTIGDIFINKKEKIDYNTFKDFIIRKERYELFIPLISFFYDNKPFNNEEINEIYIEYYTKGKNNFNGGYYKIKNVVTLKESETKEKENILNMTENFRHSSIYKRNKSYQKLFENSNENSFKLNKAENKNNIDIINTDYFENSDKLFNIKDININKNKIFPNKENYNKLVLKSNGFDRMRKSLPLVIGNSNILKIQKDIEINKDKKQEKFISVKDQKIKNFINKEKFKKPKKKREQGLIYNFCQNIIKNKYMTVNDEISNCTEDCNSFSLQKSVALKFSINSNETNDISWKNNNKDKQIIKYESYLYKMKRSGKLKKLYFKLNNRDLFYFKNKDSKIHKGMHNLSTYFLELKPISNHKINNSYNSEIYIKQNNSEYKIIIKGVYYYFFLLINIKGEIHYYYTPDIEIYKDWVNSLKIILKYKNIYKQYIFRQLIGKGKNCSVFCAYDIINKREVAIKKINKSILTLEDLSLIQTEVDTLKVCQHPYVVKLYEIIETYNEINIVLEYCELGNLYYYLSKIKLDLKEEEIANLIHNISKALYSIHNLGIIHRDLKLSNIALTKKTGKIEIRILDFGLSKILGPKQTCNEGYGTPGYAAPEVICRNNYSFEADIWSIGVIMYFLCMRKLPFDYYREGNNKLDMVENTLLDEVRIDKNIMKKYSKYAELFIIDLMNKNTNERPNITEVLEHPWLQLFFKKEVKKRIINTYKNEFYENPDIEDLYTCDDNIENDNSKDIRANYLLYTNINNK